jgi:hypothetical protein
MPACWSCSPSPRSSAGAPVNPWMSKHPTSPEAGSQKGSAPGIILSGIDVVIVYRLYGAERFPLQWRSSTQLPHHRLGGRLRQ